MTMPLPPLAVTRNPALKTVRMAKPRALAKMPTKERQQKSQSLLCEAKGKPKKGRTLKKRKQRKENTQERFIM